DLRCKVVGEGGNLGATQLGRIEYALAGGQIFTDAIDNSAGVDCSDHEVNIKIFLNRILQNGGLTLENRNALLAEMQDEVARLVLRDNYEHARILSSVLASSQDGLAVQIRLLRELEREGHLNRAIEFLPDDKTLKARHAAGLGLTGPECAVLMAYSKTVIKKSLLSSSLPDEPYFFSYFQRAFPKVMAERYGDRMKQHPLYREIVATQVTNDLFRFVGMAFVHRLLDETGATPSMIVRAFIVAKESFGMPKIWDEIEILDGVTPMNLQSQMMHEVERIVRRATRWLLRNRRSGFEIEAAIEEFKPKIEVLMELIPAHLSKEDRKRIKDDVTRYHAAGVPKELAIQISSFQFMSPAFHIVDATTTKKTSLEEMAQVFLRLSERLSFGWFRSELSHAVEAGYWGMLAGAALRDDLDKLERMLALCVLRDTHSDLPIEERIQEWCLGFESMIRRWEVMVLDLKSGKREFVMYLIAMRGLSDLAQAATHGIKHYKNRKVQLGM
ncbi:MAG: NAD-glutamate dehydrogenase, partial [Alphaproteobacteria bacterium]|nr:NAD-glutamate dehydrogenase [Alphaproteobacteria bacterium]